jgi:hypothetical protein
MTLGASKSAHKSKKSDSPIWVWDRPQKMGRRAALSKGASLLSFFEKKLTDFWWGTIFTYIMYGENKDCVTVKVARGDISINAEVNFFWGGFPDFLDI